MSSLISELNKIKICLELVLECDLFNSEVLCFTADLSNPLNDLFSWLGTNNCKTRFKFDTCFQRQK